MKNMPGWFKSAMADGGAVSKDRISEDSKREAARLKGKRDAEIVGAGGLTGAGLGTLAGLGSSISKAGRVGRAIGMGMTGAGAYLSSKALPENDEDREIDRIKAGRVKPGEEDRKSGGRVNRKDGGKNWIAGAIKKPGSLRKALHAKEGEPIPAKKLDKAAHSDNPTLARRANLAKTLKGFNR